jgi:hypothetical protein
MTPGLRATDKDWLCLLLKTQPAVKSSSNSGKRVPTSRYSFLIGRLTGNPGPAGYYRCLVAQLSTALNTNSSFMRLQPTTMIPRVVAEGCQTLTRSLWLR